MLYSAVNKLNNVPLRINKLLLNFLDNEGKIIWDNYLINSQNDTDKILNYLL